MAVVGQLEVVGLVHMEFVLDVVEMTRDDKRLGLVKSMVGGVAKTRSRLASNA